MKYFGLIYLVFLIQVGAANAATQAKFLTGKHAQIQIDNKTTSDADFLYNLLKVPAESDGKNLSKLFSTPNQQLVLNCKRSTKDASVTSCMVDVYDVPYSVTVISAEQKEIFADLENDIAQSALNNLLLDEVIVSSPDGHLTWCSACGVHDGELTMTWK